MSRMLWPIIKRVIYIYLSIYLFILSLHRGLCFKSNISKKRHVCIYIFTVVYAVRQAQKSAGEMVKRACLKISRLFVSGGAKMDKSHFYPYYLDLLIRPILFYFYKN
ncbi:hypothetical protein CLU79DRAFT_780006, partial [Phycomyces nitens]